MFCRFATGKGAG